VTIWNECLEQYGGPFLFGERTAADAMYAPVVTRFVTYDVKLEPHIAEYGQRIMALPDMQQWLADAQQEADEIDELDVEF
jgi:glutathione S-transferase